MKVEEIMTREPATVTPGTTVRDAAKLMQREDTGILPVVESEGTKRLVGVVTDRDIAIRIVGEGRDGNTRVSEVMTSSRLATLRPDASVDDLMETMADEQVRRVPIVDDRGTLVGMVTLDDVLSSLLGPTPDEFTQSTLRINAPRATRSRA